MSQQFVISMKAVLDAAGVKTGTVEAERYISDLNRSATEQIRQIQAASANAVRVTATMRTDLGEAMQRHALVQSRVEEMGALGKTIQAERALEAQRLKAQISERGRADSINRLAALAHDAAAASNALRTAEIDLVTANTAVERSALSAANAIQIQASAERAAVAAAQARINSSYGIGTVGRSQSEASADIAAYGRELDALRAKYNPVYAAMQRYLAIKAEIRQAEAVGAISTEEATAALNRERQATLASVAAMKGRITDVGHLGKAVGNASFQTRNLQYQMIDVAQGIPLMFQSPTYALLNFANQGAQIAQIYGPEEGGVGRAFKEAAGMVGGFVARFVPLAAGAAAASVAMGAFVTNLNRGQKAQVGFMDVVGGTWDVLAAKIGDVGGPVFDWFGDAWDETAKAIGSSFKNTGNAMVGTFVFAFDAVNLTWKQLPAVLGDATLSTANAVIAGTESMVNGAIDLLNQLIRAAKANPLTAGLAGGIGEIDSVKIKPIDNPFKNALSGWGEELGAAGKRAFSTDWMGQAFDAIGDAARKRASALTDEEKKAAEKLAAAYDKIVLSVNRKIDALKAEAAAIGKSALETNALKYAQDLLNQAFDAGITITGKVKETLTGLGKKLAETEAGVKRLKDIYDFGKEATKGFFSDLKSGLDDGKNAWESFGSAVTNVLNKIADKALDSLAGDIWDGIWDAGKTDTGGNIIDTLFGWLFPSAKGNVFSGKSLDAYVNTIVTKPTVFPFAKGGSFGVMGEAGSEAVMPLTRDSNGILGVRVANDNAANQNAQAAGGTTINVYNQSSARVTEIEEPDGKGGRRSALVIEDTVASAFARPGSPARRAVGGMGQLVSR